MKIPEILAPAGSMEALETACLYGADAVYLGIQGQTSLRAGAKNFTLEGLRDAVTYAHARGVMVYLTLNTYPTDDQLEEIALIIEEAENTGTDAIIVSDPGVLKMVKKRAPSIAIHLSTQANTLNTESIQAWQEMGIDRVILARELSCEQIQHIRDNTSMELELFVHGSVCISISGRCLISNYLTARDANQGQCSQPCRWDYALVERTKHGEYMPIVEDNGHTFLYNSKDLSLMPVMDRVLGLGLAGIKIEGRNKTPLYIATIVSAYRQCVDAWKDQGPGFRIQDAWIQEVSKVSNRGLFTGFFDHKPGIEGVNHGYGGYHHTHHLAAKVIGKNASRTVFEARNPLIEGMEMEWLSSSGEKRCFPLENAFSGEHGLKKIRPNEIFEMETTFTPLKGELIRKPFSEGDKII
ncbi:MAG: peptidase U32 family protein [Thermodesulfobacteriota bacterium]|nr:peptidase U32 family protein [Thermodesulfobacteriota bacterium]